MNPRFDDLRREAEALLERELEFTEPASDHPARGHRGGRPEAPSLDPAYLLAAQDHELHVHKIELELQNAQLQATNLELERLKDEYADLFDRAPLGYLALDAGGVIVQANLAGCGLMGALDRQHLIGRRLLLFVAEGHRTTFVAFMRRILETAEQQTIELKMSRGDGTPWFARIDGNVAAPGQEPAIRVVFTDITEQHRAQTALLDLHLNLDTLVEQRASQITSLSDQLQTFMHSVRQALVAPLQEARNALLPLRAGPVADHPHRAEAAADQVSRVQHRVTALLQLFELGHQPLRRVPVDMNWVLKRTSYELVLDLSARHASLNVPPLPVIQGDSQSLQTIFSNLIWTALRALPQEPGAVIDLSVEDVPEAVRFGIHFRAPGFEMSRAAEVFGVFQQVMPADEHSSNVHLAVTRRLVERHGGSVWVDSELGGVTTFWLQFPH